MKLPVGFEGLFADLMAGALPEPSPVTSFRFEEPSSGPPGTAPPPDLPLAEICGEELKTDEPNAQSKKPDLPAQANQAQFMLPFGQPNPTLGIQPATVNRAVQDFLSGDASVAPQFIDPVDAAFQKLVGDPTLNVKMVRVDSQTVHEPAVAQTQETTALTSLPGQPLQRAPQVPETRQTESEFEPHAIHDVAVVELAEKPLPDPRLKATPPQELPESKTKAVAAQIGSGEPLNASTALAVAKVKATTDAAQSIPREPKAVAQETPVVQLLSKDQKTGSKGLTLSENSIQEVPQIQDSSAATVQPKAEKTPNVVSATPQETSEQTVKTSDVVSQEVRRLTKSDDVLGDTEAETPLDRQIEGPSASITRDPHSGPPTTVVATAIAEKPDVRSVGKLSNELRDRVLNQVADRIEMLAATRKDSVTILLAPIDLGEVKLVIDQVDGQLAARIYAQDERVRQVLQASHPQLSQSLDQRGIKLDTFQVSDFSASGREFAQRQESASDQRAHQPISRPKFESEPARVPTMTLRGRGVDYTI